MSDDNGDNDTNSIIISTVALGIAFVSIVICVGALSILAWRRYKNDQRKAQLRRKRLGLETPSLPEPGYDVDRMKDYLDQRPDARVSPVQRITPTIAEFMDDDALAVWSPHSNTGLPQHIPNPQQQFSSWDVEEVPLHLDPIIIDDRGDELYILNSSNEGLLGGSSSPLHDHPHNYNYTSNYSNYGGQHNVDNRGYMDSITAIHQPYLPLFSPFKSPAGSPAMLVRDPFSSPPSLYGPLSPHDNPIEVLPLHDLPADFPLVVYEDELQLQQSAIPPPPPAPLLLAAMQQEQEQLLQHHQHHHYQQQQHHQQQQQQQQKLQQQQALNNRRNSPLQHVSITPQLQARANTPPQQAKGPPRFNKLGHYYQPPLTTRMQPQQHATTHRTSPNNNNNAHQQHKRSVLQQAADFAKTIFSVPPTASAPKAPTTGNARLQQAMIANNNNNKTAAAAAHKMATVYHPSTHKPAAVGGYPTTTTAPLPTTPLPHVRPQQHMIPIPEQSPMHPLATTSGGMSSPTTKQLTRWPANNRRVPPNPPGTLDPKQDGNHYTVKHLGDTMCSDPHQQQQQQQHNYSSATPVFVHRPPPTPEHQYSSSLLTAMSSTGSKGPVFAHHPFQPRTPPHPFYKTNPMTIHDDPPIIGPSTIHFVDHDESSSSSSSSRSSSYTSSGY